MFNLFKSTLDDDYWDKKTTNLEYMSSEYKKKKQEKIIKNLPENNEQLYQEAKQNHGDLSFKDELKKLNYQQSYIDFDEKLLAISLGIGFAGAATAITIDSLDSDKKEAFIKKQLNAPIQHPSDFYMGNEHRYMFGHDICNIFQKLPKGYKLPAQMNFNGESVGGQSFFNLVQQQYFSGDKSSLAKPFFNIFEHMSTDIVTNKGLPMPCSSHFTNWKENPLNATGFSAENKIMENLGQQLGSINESDFASIIVMKVMTEAYLQQYRKDKRISKEAYKIIKFQINTVTTATALVVQLMILLLFSKNINAKQIKKVNGGKLNIIMLGIFFKNSIQLYNAINAENKIIHQTYDDSIKLLSKDDITIESWINSL